MTFERKSPARRVTVRTGQEKDLTMQEIAEQAKDFNRNTSIWSSEFSLNSREFIRVELAEINSRSIISVRRWFKPLDGSPPRPTKRGLACDVRHLPDITASLTEALRQARAAGLLSDGGPLANASAVSSMEGVDEPRDTL
jgi:hypothetical protein